MFMQPGISVTNVPAATTLAEFAAGLHFDSIPTHAIERATHCLIDAVACAMHGARMPWSQILQRQTELVTNHGLLARPITTGPGAVRETALVWGTQAHAFELDSLCRPSAGVHPGATIALPALALAQARRSSGRALLASIVAGCEVMFRIGAATLHTPEKRGFHAPGLNGPFGAATACGNLLGFSVAQYGNAFGIAGSLSAGLLAFSKATRGGMVKRLHMGRAAESGVLAAQLAAGGFEGPDTVIDGRFGYLQAFCNETLPQRLTEALGSTWKIESLCLKKFACHITAHAPVQLLANLKAQHGFAGVDIAAIRLGVTDKVLSHHTERRPADMMQAQYSVPFLTAISAFRDPNDPNSFAEDTLADAAILRLVDAMDLVPKSGDTHQGWGVEMEVRLKDGRVVADALEIFPGCPEQPFTLEQLRAKFDALTAHATADTGRLFDLLKDVASLDDVSRLWEIDREA
jgi:2-methylcitrate dehydratase PrpD